MMGIINGIPKKPIRPLTAYHIFFQIEREYIIQTMDGDIADQSTMDNKVHLDDVPQRYKNIRLLPDWYAGPGKRQKRKHRKQHGKIGFLELSRIVSTRWAELEQVDPETKSFVQKIAKVEIDQYYKEMKEYKELTKDLFPEQTTPKKKKTSTMKPNININSHLRPLLQNNMPFPDMISSLYHQVGTGNLVNMSMPQALSSLDNDMDFFLSCVKNGTQHLLPSMMSGNQQNMPVVVPPSINVSNNKQDPNKGKTFHYQDYTMPLPFDSSMDVSSHFNQICSQSTTQIQRRISNGSSGGCPSPPSSPLEEVDLCDDEIMNLWKNEN